MSLQVFFSRLQLHAFETVIPIKQPEIRAGFDLLTSAMAVNQFCCL